MVEFKTLKEGDWFYIGPKLYIKSEKTLYVHFGWGKEYKYFNAVSLKDGSIIYVSDDTKVVV